MNLNKYLSISLAVIVIVMVSVGVAHAAFLGPSQAPPGGGGLLAASSTTRSLEITTTTVYSVQSKLLFQTIGTNQHILFSPSGYIGIGTSTPAYLLDVFGSVRAGGGGSFIGSGVNLTSISPANITASAFAASPYAFPSALAVGTSTTTGLPTEGLYVKGNVGIGTTTPASPLTVVGAIRSTTGGFIFPDTTTQTTAAAASTNYWTLSGSNLYPTSTSYNVGIGTTTPATLFTVATTTNIFNVTSAGKVGIGTATPATLFSVATTSPIFHVTSAGNVGIGTTTPASPLTVVGAIRSTTGGFIFPDTTTQTTAATAGTNYWTLSGSNLYPTSTSYKIGIGTSTPSQTLSVVGTSTFSGNVGIGTATPTTGKLVVSGGNLDVTTNKIINLATPTASADAATKGYVDAATGGGQIFKRVFVTSVTYDGNLGGLSGADSKCATRATAAGLTGTWRAIISTYVSSQGIDAIDHVGYNWDVLVNRQGGIVAAWPRAATSASTTGMSDLWDSVLFRPVKYDEYGNIWGITQGVWTGTTAGGLVDTSYNCYDWTDGTASYNGIYGFAIHMSSSWIYGGSTTCDSSYHIYCIEQ